MRWSAGDAVVLREIWRGKVWAARPLAVVRDSDDLVMFCGAARGKAAATAEGELLRLPSDDWILVDAAWGITSLSFRAPEWGNAAALALWDGRYESFKGWYINLETPLRRTPIGFDYEDLFLDLEVAPDLSSWSWKDEDELVEAVERGLFSAEQAAGFRTEGKRALERLLDREPPFDRDWDDWQPDPSWPVPTLPEGWDVVEPEG